LEGSATTVKASPDRGGLIPENNSLIRDTDDPDEHWLGAVHLFGPRGAAS
jgi:hypothetical protein